MANGPIQGGQYSYKPAPKPVFDARAPHPARNDRGGARNRPEWSRGGDPDAGNPYADFDYGAYGNPPGGNPYGNTSGGGGSRGGGGGGGGGSGSTAGIDQGSWDAILAQIRRSEPDTQAFTGYDAPDYDSLDYMAWDPSQFNTARTGLNEGIAADRQYGQGVLNDASSAMQASYRNPYGTPQITEAPSMQGALGRMFGANNVGNGVLESLDAQQGNATNALMQTFAGLRGAEDVAQQSRIRQLGMEGRELDYRLDADQRGLGTGIDMAEAAARSRYDEGRFGYEAGENRYGHEQASQEAMANWMRRNNVSDNNWQAGNAWSQGILDPITQLMLAGMNNGKQTLNLGGMNF